MLKNKIGVSLPWLIRSNQTNIIPYNFILNLIKQSFLRHKILLSNVYIHEFPKAIQIIFIVHPINNHSYKNVIFLLEFIRSILSLTIKKNIFFYFRLSKNLLNEVNILSEWISIKVFNEPLKLKKITKKLSKFYDSIIIENKFNR